MRLTVPLTSTPYTPNARRLAPWLAGMLLGLGLYGCTHNPAPAPPLATAPLHNPAPADPAATTAAMAPADAPRPAAQRAFDSETLYSLLAAEFAGNRRQFDLALSNYAQQARQTRDPQVAERAALLARYLGDQNTALEIAQIWRDTAPNNREALSNQAQAQLDAGQLLAALESAKQLLAQGETPMFEFIAAQGDSLDDTEHQQLQQAFQALLLQHPRNEQLLLGNALLLEQARQYPQALKLSRQALKLYPNNLSAALLEANVMHRLGERQQALAKLQARLEQQPDNHRLRLQYARLLSQSDLAGAQREFAQLSQQLPHNSDIWLAYGLVALQARDAQSARQAFAHLLQQGQHVNTSHYYLGLLDEAANQPERALEHYQQVSEGDELFPAKARLLLLHLQRGSYPLAQAHLQSLRQQQPALSTRLWLLEAETLYQQELFTLAAHSLDQAIAAEPDQIPLRYARAMQHERQQQLDQAEDDLRYILALNPDHTQALNALGYLLADRNKQLDEARQLVSRALAQAPEDPAIIDSMGWVEYRSGNLSAAIALLQRAFTLSGDAEIAAHLGEALWMSGDETQARQLWQQVLQNKPDEPHPVLRSTLQRFKVELP